MQRSLIRFLSFGILYVGIQEFWVSVIWRGDLAAFFLAVAVTEVLFLLFAYFVGKLVDRLFSWLRVADIVAYLLFGAVGLVTIEWIFAGNLPGKTEANQFVMFTTWGGAALFARLFTDRAPYLERVRKYALASFLAFVGVATALGITFSVSNSSFAFAATYIAAIFGYPAMNVFFIWFFIRKIRAK